MKTLNTKADPVFVSGWTEGLKALQARLNPNKAYTVPELQSKIRDIDMPIPRNLLTCGEVMLMFGVPKHRIRTAREAGSLRVVRLKGLKRNNRYVLEQCRALFGAPVGKAS